MRSSHRVIRVSNDTVWPSGEPKTRIERGLTKRFIRFHQRHTPIEMVARTLRRARKRYAWTQAQLAEQLQTKQSVISRIEQAKTMPSFSLIQRAATVLNTQFEFVIKPARLVRSPTTART